VSTRIVTIVMAGLLVVLGGTLALFVLERSGPARPADDTPAAPEVRPEPPVPSEREDVVRPARPAPIPEQPVAPVPPPEPVDLPPTTGALRIVSDVPDTSVFVDREFLGTAPVTKMDLLPGSYTVVLSPAGYDMVSETVDVVAGEEREVSVEFKVIRLDVAVTVVHRHTFGSCQGTLRGSPEGLTYETTNENDGFVVAFADIETFDMDYLEANLRLTIRGGRTYNFTDPDGTPDRLFAFHRDVEKVRQRVLRGGGPPVRP